MEKLNQRIVEFHDMEDVAEFVNAAGKCEFDVNVISGNLYVDAKSLLGVMSMGFARRLRVQYRDSDQMFEQELQKFCVA
ncbi:MAG: HPr family phosphocarrier protein [Lachnospiraceae bacterium]|nr:HPr family phosphocarrier protein [Lachnospiraceae bacterium]